MSTSARVAAAMASGYLLGRRRKAKLAIVVGGLLVGKRIATTPQGLLKQANELVESNPELAKLSESVRTTLFDSARQAAIGTASGGIDRLSDAIRDRTDRLTSGLEAPGAGERTDQSAEGEEPEDKAPEEGEEPPPDDTGEEPSTGESEPAPRRKPAAKKQPAKKAAAKKSSSKSTATKKSASSRRSGTAKKAASSRSRTGE